MSKYSELLKDAQDEFNELDVAVVKAITAILFEREGEEADLWPNVQVTVDALTFGHMGLLADASAKAAQNRGAMRAKSYFDNIADGLLRMLERQAGEP